MKTYKLIESEGKRAWMYIEDGYYGIASTVNSKGEIFDDEETKKRAKSNQKEAKVHIYL